jgi:hypothetical protein
MLASLLENIVANLDREYPHRIVYDGKRDIDWQPPRRRHPVFFGCYDWHSSVHSHWSMVRIARVATAVADRDVEANAIVERCSQVLRLRLSAEAIAGELDFFAERPSFELPYGMSWAALLAAELSAAADADSRWTAMAAAVAPLGALALARMSQWTARLAVPIRSGEHSQSATAMVLCHVAAEALGQREHADAFVASGRRLHAADRDYALHLEPSAWDFVSPSLGAAWLMSRCVPADELAHWLDRAAPTLGRHPLPLATATDRSDGKLVHWDGLLWSRAWMMRALADALPQGDDRGAALHRDAHTHAAAAAQSLAAASYAGLHWLPTFAAIWHSGGIEIRPGAERWPGHGSSQTPGSR